MRKNITTFKNNGRHLTSIFFVLGILAANICLLPNNVFAEEQTTQDGAVSPSYEGSGQSKQNSVKDALENMRESAKAKAKQQAEELKAEAKARRVELKKEVCERRQAKLSTIPSRITKNSTVLQDVLDRKYSKVQEFYINKNLSIANYAELKQNVDTAQAEAQTAVNTLGEFNLTINCDTPGIGQQLDGLRTATTDAKTKLKAYRKSLVDLITAISAALETTNTETSAGETQ